MVAVGTGQLGHGGLRQVSCRAMYLECPKGTETETVIGKQFNFMNFLSDLLKVWPLIRVILVKSIDNHRNVGYILECNVRAFLGLRA